MNRIYCKLFVKRNIFYFLFIIISFSLFNSFYSDKHLSTDGVHYFALILDSCDFIRFDWSRGFSVYLSQWPLVLAVNLGLTDIQILKKIFAVGIYLPYLMFFLLCIYALRDDEKSLLIFPLISMAVICLSSDFILVSESLVMANVSWPILLILLRKKPLSWVDGSLLWVLLFIFCRLYQTSLIPAIIYIVVCIVRLFYYEQRKQRIIMFGSILLSLAVIAVSLFYIIFSTDSANTEGFFFEMIPTSFMSIVIIIAIVRSLKSLNKNAKSVIFSILLIIAAQIIIFAGLKIFMNLGISDRLLGNGVLAVFSFENRTLTITLLPLLLISAICVRYFKIEMDRLCMLFFTLLILTMVFESILTTYQWRSFRSQLIQTVEKGNGYIPIEDTIINDNPCRWVWNNSELGLVWSSPNIKAILLNDRRLNDIHRWQPFDPRRTQILKKYLTYKLSN